MFTPKNDNNNLDAQIAESEKVDVSDEELVDNEIYTMPDKYLNSTDSKIKPQKKSRLSWWLLGIVLFLALGGVIVVVFLFLNDRVPVEPNEPMVNQPVVNQNTNTDVQPEEPKDQEDQDQLNNTQFDLSNPVGRDNKRINDIIQLRTALISYYNTYQAFPSNLNSLATSFVKEVPVNPSPGGQEYAYQANDIGDDFVITFLLEEGGTCGIVNLDQGNYYATTQGIFVGLPPESNDDLPIEPEEPVEEPELPENSLPSLGLDSDGDEMTDIEELLYETDSNLADTDNDGFTDSSEILSFYDPTLPEARLIDSGLIDIYQNQESGYNYSVFYPKKWTARRLDGTVIFSSTTGEFIEIVVTDNDLGLNINEWYSLRNPSQDMTLMKAITIDGLPAIQTPDGLSSFLALGNKIYRLTYNIGVNQQMNFYLTYRLMVKSFIFLDN